MKRFFQVGTRFKICCVFIVIIVLVLLNNLRERRNMSRLDQSISSIYKDRLLPATYLHRIANHLYEQKLTGGEGHLAAIDSLVTVYETTYLTPDEKKKWSSFKAHLSGYRTQTAKGDSLGSQSEFRETIADLIGLSNIQIGEGKNLETDSHKVLSGSVLSSQLEMTLLIILGLLATILLFMLDTAFGPTGPHSLN
ncbi:MCP four helix bundle domain-containing protein [uncultured Chitinophaga sp.]|jgi:hypothetical protein|uniref:MCP four helix bundle domain-containing protein n=1 Tax=uncultured Chitinophaga sp. TaxID=339340 RepID=UPI002639ED6D|nr:MCP four helix bundle domain-containing protein [uncultured Chitinophaga sp.]